MKASLFRVTNAAEETVYILAVDLKDAASHCQREGPQAIRIEYVKEEFYISQDVLDQWSKGK